MVARERKENESDQCFLRICQTQTSAPLRARDNVIADLYFILIMRCFIYFRRSSNYMCWESRWKDNETSFSKRKIVFSCEPVYTGVPWKGPALAWLPNFSVVSLKFERFRNKSILIPVLRWYWLANILIIHSSYELLRTFLPFLKYTRFSGNESFANNKRLSRKIYLIITQ